VDHSSVQSARLERGVGGRTGGSRRHRSHVVLAKDSLDDLEARLASCHHESSPDPVEPVEPVTDNAGIGQIPAVGPNPGGGGDNAVAYLGSSNQRTRNRPHPGHDVARWPAQPKELPNIDPEGTGYSDGRIDPRQMSPRLDGTNQLPTDPGPCRQLTLAELGQGSVGAQIHASNLALLLDFCL
jgi:hypothetical protein